MLNAEHIVSSLDEDEGATLYRYIALWVLLWATVILVVEILNNRARQATGRWRYLFNLPDAHLSGPPLGWEFFIVQILSFVLAFTIRHYLYPDEDDLW
ncbi:hypothetical protein FA95DRAFT_1561008 [Auriscalpium vulgare]|uniref:Uncharacterized protein n=1 Tax=Auriscalpium vulgare TaxID=40419 RepID=A0ACB8RP07_9AGAM|nr:hypothetical protein FA95DRAFT_1561008 [Auriscalpium vulgare]